MRIVSGKYKGHIISAPKGNKTHPMGDRVKTALFNTLGDISDLTLLDAFSGSGALAIEAISRDAKNAVAIELDKEAYKTIIDNINKLDIANQIRAYNLNARTWLNNNKDQLFDIVICDPPYDQLQENLIERLAEVAKINGIVVYSLPPYADLRLDNERYNLLAKKSFGDATLAFYRKLS